MREMKYYYLVMGDYIQSGDEYRSPQNEKWLLVDKQYYGVKYGFSLVDPTRPTKWVDIRRLVPDGFKPPSRIDDVPIQEQYGFDFEV